MRTGDGYTRGDLVADRAEEWIDVPFHDQGRIRAGVDCKGLPVGIAAELGFPEAQSIHALAGDYETAKPPVQRLRAGLAELFDRASEPRRGDLLLLQCNGRPQHLAIYAPKGPSGGLRVIEAMCRGPMRVRPYRRSLSEVDSIWRWRDG